MMIMQISAIIGFPARIDPEKIYKSKITAKIMAKITAKIMAKIMAKIPCCDPFHEPYLLTPGPLTTARQVKQAMCHDWGSWDSDFRAMTADLRARLLAIAGDQNGEYDCIPIQGSGSFVVEAMLGSFLSPQSKSLVLINGVYGQRIADILAVIKREYQTICTSDYLPPDIEQLRKFLRADPTISHVICVHCETSSGILNPIGAIAKIVTSEGRKLLVDSMSAFGAIPAGIADFTYDVLVSSANKCLEGVPGFGYVIARKRLLPEIAGNSHSLALDIHAQWAYMEQTGQWRYTPPTHVIAAFLTALRLYETQGGAKARLARYQKNFSTLVAGMRDIGFATLLSDTWLSPIIVSFFNPADRNFDFSRFYDCMKQQGFIIYPGKLTKIDSFRIGCIGAIDETVMKKTVVAARNALRQMGVTSAAPRAAALQERDNLYRKYA